MSTSRQVLGVCDVCGFRYKLRELRKNSYGLMVCPMDYEGQYNKQNHPQNNIPKSLDVETIKVPARRAPMPPTTVTVTDWLPS